ncbi:cellulase family glycosylhydrolase [Nonlabens xiamenensis]|uniref:cellulase family glycosylhydrolase n=1 Tax=Nonlabens xiamenensis TaxID=2341043 RepID=UPI000F613DB8|nr:cellulase family glycosylhydrolase [Nonlabens xiamenensis]
MKPTITQRVGDSDHLKKTIYEPFFLLIAFLSLSVCFGQSIVQEHGRLRVQGNKVVNKNNSALSLAGNVLFWSNYSVGGKFYNSETVNHLASDWNTDIVRASMGVENPGGYITNPTREMNKVKAVVDAAIAADIYVIIDFHSHYAEQYEAQAITFFTEMAELYGDNDHVIYEVYNEPINTPWPTIKSYAENVIDAIRTKDPDNLIVVGTRFYSQEVEEASINPINKSNIAYTLHFYAGTHTQYLRDKATAAMNNGIALFVTEWGAVNADGNGAAAIAETNRWMDFLRDNNISHANWSVSDKDEGASVVAPNTGVQGLLNNNLTSTGVFIKDIIKNWNDNTSGGGGSSSQSAFAPHSIPGTIEAEDYDLGGQGVAYNDGDNTNNGGLYRDDAVDIQSTMDSGGGFNIGWTSDGEWLEYTIGNVAAGNYDITIRVASIYGSSKSISLSLDGSTLGNISIPNTNGWQSWNTVRLNDVTISGGTNKVLRLDVNGGRFNINKLSFTATPNGGGSGNDCAFGAPQSQPLQAYPGVEFPHVFVLGNGGPNAANIRKFQINWDPRYNGLYTFAINTNNGNPSYYVDLRSSINARFNRAQPDVSISGSGIPNLDGNYWVTNDGDNFVMVAKNGNYTIYCSQNSSVPNCGLVKSYNKVKPGVHLTDISVYPNPADELVHLDFAGIPKQNTQLILVNSLGQMVKTIALSNKNNVLEVENLTPGLYFIEIKNGDERITRKLLIH